MPNKWSGGCNCVCGGDPPPPQTTCEEIWDGGWRWGTPAVARTIHEDFTGFYSNFVQREERVFDAGDNLLSTTVISETYNSGYTATGPVTETVDESAAYCGEYIKNVSDSFQSETLVSSEQDLPVFGQRTDTYDVTYQRNADIRVSNGIMAWSEWTIMDTLDPNLSGNIDSVSYINPSLSYDCPRLDTPANAKYILWKATSKLIPAGYSQSVDGLEDDIDTLPNFTALTGIPFATSEGVTTAAGVDALRNGEPEGATGTFEFPFTWSTATYSLVYNFVQALPANGTDNTLTLVMQKPSGIGPRGCGFAAAGSLEGREDPFQQEPDFGATVKPVKCLWDEANTIVTGGKEVILTIPSDKGFILEFDKDCGPCLGTLSCHKTLASAQNNPTVEYWYRHDINDGRTGLFFNLDTGTPTHPFGHVNDNETTSGTVASLLADLGYAVYEFPWKSLNQDSLCSSSYSFMPLKEYTTANAAGNYVAVNIDDDIAPNTAWDFTDDSKAKLYIEQGPIHWTTGRTYYGDNNGDMPNAYKWTGGDYYLRLTDTSTDALKDNALRSLCRMKIVSFDETGCPTIDGCSDTLAMTNDPNIVRSSSLRNSGNSTLGFSSWLLDATGSSVARSIGTPANGRRWMISENQGCNSIAYTRFDGTLFNGDDTYVCESTFSLTGTASSATITGVLEMRTMFNNSLISGPYNFTIAGLDLTAAPFTTLSSTGQYDGDLTFLLYLGRDDNFVYGADKWAIETPDTIMAFDDIGGTISTGTTPFTTTAGNNSAFWLLRLSCNNNPLTDYVINTIIQG